MTPKTLYSIALGALALLFAYAFYATAWVVDDAYITFRTVDNFVNGHGLTWNVAERVQAYSHPLWMFLVSACYLFTSAFFCPLPCAWPRWSWSTGSTPAATRTGRSPCCWC